jgi:hypothetical protein
MDQAADYLSQVTTVANGIAAAAFTQNLGFTLAILAPGGLRNAIIRATAAWCYLPIAVGALVYAALLVGCWSIETGLLQLTLRGPALMLTVGRIAVVLMSAAPVAFAMMSVRQEARTRTPPHTSQTAA